jgi:transposase-like protein
MVALVLISHYLFLAMASKRIIKRYTEEEKSEILAFIEKHNAEKGRGGVTAAAKKFKATPVTIASWLKKSGKKTVKAKKTAKKRNPSKLWERLNAVRSEIAKAEKSLAKLNAEAKVLRKEIRACID